MQSARSAIVWTMVNPRPLPTPAPDPRSKREVSLSRSTGAIAGHSFATVRTPSAVNPILTTLSGAPCFSAFSIKLRHRMPKVSGSRSDRTAASDITRSNRSAPADLRNRTRLGQERSQVPRVASSQASALGTGKLQHFFRKPCQALERLLDLGPAPCRFGVQGLRLKTLRLRDGPGKRRSQLVRGVGGEAAFGVEGRLAAGPEGCSGSTPSVRSRKEILSGHGRQIPCIARREPVPKAAQGGETGANREDDREEGERNHDEKRQSQAHLDFTRHCRAVLQRLGHGDPDAALQSLVVVEPMGRGLAKARPVPCREHCRIRRVRLQQDAPLASRTM